MTRDQYVSCLQDLFSREPERVRDANRRLYPDVVDSVLTPASRASEHQSYREADLVLAEVAG